ncbi:tyrosine--tRNA ligase [bacterium]|jgi:tyrosyl-tRNA synthetase|nr:tyrosine--tRNA ligase [bacterium]
MNNKLELLERFKSGLEDIIPEEELDKALLEKSLTIKWGADPSAPDLHLGHMVVLNKLKILQDMGHTVQFLIGDFTARIGDPTGKSATRKSLDVDEVKQNAQTYQDQVFKILDSEKTKVVYNADWLASMSAEEVVRLTAQFTVARMLERDDFQKRYSSETPISIHEFLYPLFQGQDSVVLESDMEIGGTDQKFNLLVGRQLQKQAGKKPQMIVTCPILEGLDGVQKMSKSLNNHVGIMDAPEDMFGKLMSIPDALIPRYFALLTEMSSSDIEGHATAIKSGSVNPRDIKVELAKVIIARLHSPDLADKAEAHFDTVFRKKDIPEDIPETYVSQVDIKLLDLMVEYQMTPSKKEARRLMEQGAVSLAGNKVTDLDAKWDGTDDQVLKIGKRRFYRLRRS